MYRKDNKENLFFWQTTRVYAFVQHHYIIRDIKHTKHKMNAPFVHTYLYIVNCLLYLFFYNSIYKVEASYTKIHIEKEQLNCIKRTCKYIYFIYVMLTSKKKKQKDRLFYGQKWARKTTFLNSLLIYSVIMSILW